jgi:hypothetical protein
MRQMSSSRLIMVSLLVIGHLICVTPVAWADTPGLWKPTGSMATSRRHSACTSLPDGRILVVGGTDTTGVDGAASIFYATAEIYDPATGTWTATGSLTTGGRALHNATTLWNGTVLVTGGWNGSAALSSAEIYNPVTGTFSATTGPMTTARADHRQTTLYDGRILITGGFNSSGLSIASAEIYDPVTKTFSATKGGAMSAARSAHRTSTVGDGKVLITGGFGPSGAALATAELFDPVTEDFTGAGSLHHARARHAHSVLPTGEVLVSGGHSGIGVLSSTEIYNPDTNTFTVGAYLNEARQTHGSQLLPNGLVLISGGNSSTSGDWDVQTNFLSSTELYDPVAGSFTTADGAINATCNRCGFLLWTGKFLAAGGGTNEAELYNPLMPGTAETWEATGSMAAPRTSYLYNLLDDGRFLIIGGLDSAGTPLASAELYDYATGTFTSTGSMSTPRQQHRSVLLYTGKVLVTGGRPDATASPNVLNSAELYDPVSGTFAPTGNMLRYRRLHRSTPLPDGRILITGGLGGQTSADNGLPTLAEIYDPATGEFTATATPLNTGRRSHQVILLYTGKVLIAGGYGAGSVLLNSAELYDPATGTFTPTGNMNTARSPFLNRLPDGRILVTAGADGTPIQSLEIYDPADGTFTPAGNGLVARGADRVIRLDSGKTMLIGGRTTTDPASVTSSAELYNHVTETYSATGSLITGRQDFGHASLPNGRILVAGGVAANGAVLSSAELYTPLIGDEVDTTITSGPDALTNSSGATFNFTATAPGSTFTCSLDSSTFVSCTSPRNYGSLADGSHRFQVHATDSFGNTDPTPATYDWTVDATPPDTVIDTKPSNPASLPDADFTFHSTETGSTFECQLDGGGYSACTSPKQYTGLTTGDHTFNVRATDRTSNTDPTPASYAWTIALPAKVTLFAPNGGETIPSSSTYEIRWGAPPEATTFKLFYSLDNGTTWKSINTGAPLTGSSYLWQVPKTGRNKTTCRIKVTGYNGSKVVGADTSNKPFTIEVIKVLSPNGGEFFQAGGPWTIQWRASSEADHFDLTFSMDNGLTWKAIEGGKGVTGTEFITTLLPPDSGNKTTCRVKVTAFDSTNKNVGNDLSDKPFTAEVIRLTEPNGGGLPLISGEPATITWTTYDTAQPITKVLLSYSLDGGLTWVKITTPPGFTGNPGFFDWTVPKVTKANKKCKVKVVLKDATSVTRGSDLSDNYFTISP